MQFTIKEAKYINSLYTLSNSTILCKFSRQFLGYPNVKKAYARNLRIDDDTHHCVGNRASFQKTEQS